MKLSHALYGVLFLIGLAPIPLHAAAAVYATEQEAQTACTGDQVVWIDLDRGRYYHKGQTAFGNGNNGGYACLKVAHAQYREGHS